MKGEGVQEGGTDERGGGDRGLRTRGKGGKKRGQDRSRRGEGKRQSAFNGFCVWGVEDDKKYNKSEKGACVCV